MPQDLSLARDTAASVLDLISKRTLTEAERQRVVEDSVRYWTDHVNEGFLHYRKSVSTDYTAVEWEDEGAVFRDVHGREYLDILGGFGIYVVGHRHPRVMKAVRDQLDRQAIHSQELIDPLRTYLARLTALVTPGDLNYCFFSNSGTESVEGCLKMAMLTTGRKHLIGTIGAFHGKTLGALGGTSKAMFREPFLPLSVLREPVVRLGTAAACCAMGTFIGLSIYVPVFLESARGLPAAQSGVALIPLMSGVIVGAVSSARLMMRIRHYRRPPLAGLVIAMAGCIALALHPSWLPLPAVELLLAAVGAGIGTVLPVTTIAIQNAVPMHQLGTATGVMSFFRALGGAVAVAGLGALILGRGGADGIVGDLDVLFGRLFLSGAGGLGLAFVWLALMPERPLRDRLPRPGEAAEV